MLKKYLAYPRVSSKKRADNDNSLPLQKRLIADHAAKTGKEIVAWYTEVHSAFQGRRPEFHRMIEHLQNPEIAGVIFHKLDRSARNMDDFALLDRMMKLGKDIEVIEGSFDTSTPSGRLAFRNYCNQCVFYSENLSSEVTSKMGECLRRGQYPAHAPIGYRDGGKTDPDRKKKYPDPATSVFVKEAFELMASGNYSVRTLARYMVSRGLANTAGNPPNKSAFQAMLRNPFYHGKIRWKAKKSGEITFYAGNHEPLISEELFKRVQTVMDDRLAPNKAKHDHVYRRLVHCSCGRFLIPSLHKGHVYMVCQNTLCSFKSVRESQLEDAILVALSRLCLSDNYSRHAEEAVRRLRANTEERTATERSALQSQLSTVEHRLQRLKALVLDGFLSVDEAGADKHELTGRQADLRLRLRQLDAVPPVPDAETLHQAVARLADLPLLYRTLNPLLRRRIVDALFSRREIREGRLHLETTPTLAEARTADLLVSASELASNQRPTGSGTRPQAEITDAASPHDADSENPPSNPPPEGPQPFPTADSAWAMKIKESKLLDGRPSGPIFELSEKWCRKIMDESVSGFVIFLQTSAGRILADPLTSAGRIQADS